MIVIGDAKTFCFNFDFWKDFDGNLMHENEFIRKNNEYLAENNNNKKNKTRLNNYC